MQIGMTQGFATRQGVLLEITPNADHTLTVRIVSGSSVLVATLEYPQSMLFAKAAGDAYQVLREDASEGK